MADKYQITLDLKFVTHEILVEQDLCPIDMMSGDPAYEAEDRAMEDAVRCRLRAGDVWAWACVTVTAALGTFEGRAGVGGCCFRDEAEFVASGEYDNLKEEAIDDLVRQIKLAGGRKLIERQPE